jgi:hypothetical protein
MVRTKGQSQWVYAATGAGQSRIQIRPIPLQSAKQPKVKANGFQLKQGQGNPESKSGPSHSHNDEQPKAKADGF